MHDPESLNFSPKEISGDTIEQFYFTVDQDRKFELLDRLLKREDPKQGIVFCRTKRGTDRVANRLRKRHKKVDCIHGDLPQQARDRVMAKFRAGDVRILVATDVVGRGIDVTGISHIINYDIPQFCDDYVHRVGRTGRMSKSGVAEGVAYTFVTPEEGSELTRIEMRIDKLLGRDEIEGFQTQAQTAAAAAEQANQGPADESKRAEEKKPAPPGKRPPRRIRRAL
jgi:ATP-dependent RNA helicase DeaD